MNRSIAVAIAAVVAVAAIVSAFAFSRGGDHMTNRGMAGYMSQAGTDGDWTGAMMDMGAMPGMSMDSRGTMVMGDQAFLAMMIPHHQMAVDMSRIAIDRGRDAETTAFARKVIADQSAEITAMRKRYRDVAGSDPPRMPMSGAMGMMGMSMDLSELRTSGEPDRVFLRMMIPHHAGALLMADAVLTGTPRKDVEGLARRIVAAQAVEIGAIQKMRQRLAPPLG